MKHYNTYSHPKIEDTLNILSEITIIAPIDVATRNIEYMKPPEYDPVVIFPKNNPEIQD